jgi:penicillin-binding protein 1C
VSPRYVEAVLAYEDRFFYWHPGVNPFALQQYGVSMNSHLR